MAADSHVDLRLLNVDGGMTASDLLMQFQADVLDVPVVRPTVADTHSLSMQRGYALLCLAYGKDPDTFKDLAQAWLPPARCRCFRGRA